MSSISYFNSVNSESAWSRYNAENGKQFLDLDEAASSWGRDHLFACRVIRRGPQPNLLPILSHFSLSSDLQSASTEIKSFLRGPDFSLMSQSEHYLVRMATCSISLAQVWAALATFKGNSERRGVYGLDQGSENPPAEMRPAKRPRRYTCQGDFVDSGGIQVGSSSPPRDDSYDGSQTSSLGYFDLKDHWLGVTPEDDTLRLASCVIRHILYFAPPQENPLNTVVVDFRDAKIRVSASTVLTEQVIIATDDGGLCLRRENPAGSFSLVNNHVAILEAKARFQTLEKGRPVISDTCFAQMICEALATRLSKIADDHAEQRYIELMSAFALWLTVYDSIVIINATQHYVCFLQVDLPTNYILDFEKPSPSHFLYVTATPWFDVSQRNGRENIYANLCCIMRRATS